MTFDQIIRTYSQVVAQCWASSDFQTQLIQNPGQVLQTFGIQIPAGLTIHAFQNSSTNYYVALQDQPSNIIGIDPGLSPEQICDCGCFGTAGTLGTAGSACGTFGTAACLGTAGSWSL